MFQFKKAREYYYRASNCRGLSPGYCALFAGRLVSIGVSIGLRRQCLENAACRNRGKRDPSVCNGTCWAGANSDRDGRERFREQRCELDGQRCGMFRSGLWQRVAHVHRICGPRDLHGADDCTLPCVRYRDGHFHGGWNEIGVYDSHRNGAYLGHALIGNRKFDDWDKSAIHRDRPRGFGR